MDADTANIDRFNSPLEQTSSPQIGREENFEQAFLTLLQFKDKATYHHSNRVATITAEWTQFEQSKQQWSGINANALIQAARLHDLGKVGILDDILQKPAGLTAEERTQLNLHSELGYEMVRDVPGGSTIALAIRHHHERWDGAGYPLGLKNNQIPLFAQIIAIVDAYDAMTSERPYRASMTREQAIVEIERNAGRQFSPVLAESFVQFLHARNV